MKEQEKLIVHYGPDKEGRIVVSYIGCSETGNLGSKKMLNLTQALFLHCAKLFTENHNPNCKCGKHKEMVNLLKLLDVLKA